MHWEKRPPGEKGFLLGPGDKWQIGGLDNFWGLMGNLNRGLNFFLGIQRVYKFRPTYHMLIIEGGPILVVVLLPD